MKWFLHWCEKFKQSTFKSKTYRWLQWSALAGVLTVPVIPLLTPLLKSTLLPQNLAVPQTVAQAESLEETSPRTVLEAPAKRTSQQTKAAGATPVPSSVCLATQPSSPPPDSQLTTGMVLADSLGAMVAARSSARAFPEIAGIAKLARVPVIMYHDILPEKQVFFDVTPAEFAADLQLIQQKGLTPISLEQLVTHLSTGTPLPTKPILLSFDDGYQGHHTWVYPLLKQYGYPGVFAIYPHKVGKKLGRSSLSWQQLREMAADPLITIASHSVTHPSDLRELSERQLRDEIVESKRTLETNLGISIKYFVYPEGKYDSRVKRWITLAGYQAALTMNDAVDQFAGASSDLLSIERIGQGNLETVLDQAYGGPALPAPGALNFNDPVQLNQTTVDTVPLIFASGGKPITVHAQRRGQVGEIIAKTKAVAAVDGGFFSLEYLDSNVMVGPVFSQSTQKFVAGNVKETRRINGRPLVLISPTQVKYIPFDAEKHNTLTGIKAELPNLTDAFVAAAWLVKAGEPQSASTFGNLFDFDAARDRAFWGIDQAGRPVVGVSGDYVDSISLGKALSRAGLREAVMLDSGASASLVFAGKSQMSYEPRPVPHVVALVPPQPQPCQPPQARRANF